MAFDYSTNSRFLSVVLPFYSLVDNCFLPQGFGKFSSYYGVALKDPEKKQLFVNPAIKIAKLGYPSKSESGFGKTIFEMGFLGILLIVFIVLSTFGSIMNNWYFALGICLYLSCMFMTFPLITPISSFILGCLLYEHKKFHQRAVE